MNDVHAIALGEIAVTQLKCLIWVYNPNGFGPLGLSTFERDKETTMMGESNKKPQQRLESEEAIARRVRSDAAFRKALLNNPKEALGQAGAQVPEGVEIRVVEETSEVIYLVLPADPDPAWSMPCGVYCPVDIPCPNLA